MRMAGGNLQFTSPFPLHGGTLEGAGTVTGSVNNTGGTISPGQGPGLMTITGNYTRASAVRSTSNWAASRPSANTTGWLMVPLR